MPQKTQKKILKEGKKNPTFTMTVSKSYYNALMRYEKKMGNSFQSLIRTLIAKNCAENNDYLN